MKNLIKKGDRGHREIRGTKKQVNLRPEPDKTRRKGSVILSAIFP